MRNRLGGVGVKEVASQSSHLDPEPRQARMVRLREEMSRAGRRGGCFDCSEVPRAQRWLSSPFSSTARAQFKSSEVTTLATSARSNTLAGVVQALTVVLRRRPPQSEMVTSEQPSTLTFQRETVLKRTGQSAWCSLRGLRGW